MHDHEEKLLVRRRGYILLAILIFAFIMWLAIADMLFYIFEYRTNPQITSLNDAWRGIESIYFMGGAAGLYPVTMAGRILCFLTLILSFIFLALFIARIISMISTVQYRKLEKDITRKIDREEDDLLMEIEQSEEMENEILNKQDTILAKEESILEKLDRLRDERDKK